MSNDLVPAESDVPPTGSWLDHLNVPAVLLGPAGKAISRLIGELVDIPSAKIQQISQDIKNKTEAKKVMTQAVAQAAAQQVIADPELVKRAANSFLSKELRAQANKEAVAQKTLVELSQPNPQHPNPDKPTDPEDDWLNVFERYAEEASSPRMQSLWSKVLAGEIRKPKTFSLRTLRFIAELDSDTAQLFEKIVPSVVNQDFIPNPPRQGPEFTDALRLQDAGLLTGAGASLSKRFDYDGPVLPFSYKAHALVFMLTGKVDLNIGCLLLTQVGREIYQLSTAHDDMELARTFADGLPKNNVERAIYLPLAGGDAQSQVTFWQKPEESPPTQ